MHANIRGEGWKGNRRHRRQVLEVKNHDKWVQHVTSSGLLQGGTASDDKILLNIHVVDEGGVGAPLVDDCELDGIKDVHMAIRRSSTDVSALLHFDVVIGGGHLCKDVRDRVGDGTIGGLETVHTRLTISPLLTSTTNIVSCRPATRISEVALEVKLMHRRSRISSVLYHINAHSRSAFTDSETDSTSSSIRQQCLRYMWPDWWSPSYGHVDTPRTQGDDAFFIVQQLMDGALGRRVRAKGGIFLKIVSVERRNSALCVVTASGHIVLSRARIGNRTVHTYPFPAQSSS